jgi:hypothetical protein
MEVETNVIVEDDLLKRNNPSAHYSDLVDADDALQSERNADNSIVAGKAHDSTSGGNKWLKINDTRVAITFVDRRFNEIVCKSRINPLIESRFIS